MSLSHEAQTRDTQNQRYLDSLTQLSREFSTVRYSFWSSEAMSGIQNQVSEYIGNINFQIHFCQVLSWGSNSTVLKSVRSML
uniref:NR LBD domain-containing protein n=1 Tax=Caenorhabditis tropicalis TaxID=1561998 RepID=A0A1I7TFP4_9PELO